MRLRLLLLPLLLLVCAISGVSCRGITPGSTLAYSRVDHQMDPTGSVVVGTSEQHFDFDTAWFDGTREAKVNLDEKGRPTSFEYKSNLSTENAKDAKLAEFQFYQSLWQMGFQTAQNVGGAVLGGAGRAATGGVLPIPLGGAGGPALPIVPPPASTVP